MTATVSPVAVWARTRARYREASRRRWVAPVAITIGVAVLVGAALISAAAVDSDSGADLRHVVLAVGHDLAHLRWQFAPIVIAFAAAHYLATAIAARAASGLRTPMREMVLVQLAAAAANRITPAGLGGSAVLARYFIRRDLPARRSAGAVAALVVLGAAADLIVLLVIVTVGRAFGLGGGLRELDQLGSKLHRLVTEGGHAVVIAIGVAAAGGVGFALWQKRRARTLDRSGPSVLDPLRRLVHRPRDLGALLAASGATTLMLGFAFAATTHMTPGPQPLASLGAVVVAYMVAAAAGTIVPVPAGLGSTEAALIGVLVAAQVPAAQAVQITLVFRIVTFWSPAVIGVLASRHLRRVHAL